jgi:hypothetical protein
MGHGVRVHDHGIGVQSQCLGLLDQLATRKLTRLSVTKHGRVVAIVTPPDDAPDIRELHGFMRESVVAPDGFDFTSPALDEPIKGSFTSEGS